MLPSFAFNTGPSQVRFQCGLLSSRKPRNLMDGATSEVLVLLRKTLGEM
jgi:hypothetical protein